MISWLLAAVMAAAPGAGGARAEAKSAPASSTEQPALPDPAVLSRLAPAPTATPSRPPFRWEVPGLIAWVETAGPQISNGVPLVLQMGRSTASMETLLQHFVDSFQKAGLYVPPASRQLRAFREPQITALDPERMISYTAILQPNPDDTVTVILGTSNLSEYHPQAQSLKWAPLPPDAKQLMLTDMEGQQQAVFAASTSQEEVLRFYRGKLLQAGFQEKEPGEFHRGDERLRVSTRLEEGQLMVLLSRRLGGDASEP